MDDLPPGSPILDYNEEKPLEIKEIKIEYNQASFTFVIIKNKANIIIKCSKYEIKLTSEDLFKIIKDEKYKSIDISFEFFKNVFNLNNLKISDIQPKKMILNINYDNGKIFKLDLLFNGPSYTPNEDSKKGSDLNKETPNKGKI